MDPPNTTDVSYVRQPLGQFLDTLSAGTATPGGGAAAALTVAFGAGLAAMTARRSERQLPDAGRLAAAADALGLKAAGYADADAAAFEALQATYRLGPDREPGTRSRAIQAALIHATEVPVLIAEAGAEVAALADRVAAQGNPNLLGDAVTGALLAEAGARSAATLVAVNVASGNLDESWTDRAAAAVDAAGAAVRHATGIPIKS
jgi:formiminotetrahydrofolate cyclodeaminase